MTFEVGPDDDHPEIQNDGMQYDGLRFRAECKLAGKLYGQPFGVDVAFGDPILGEPEVVVAEDVLAFAGIAPPTLRLYPIETHIAEKLHAYTMPRARPNSRVKDLPDLALLATAQPLDAKRLQRRARADLHVPQDARAAGFGAGTARRVGDAVRGDGARGPARLAHARRRHEGGPGVPRSGARRRARRHVEPGGLGVETTVRVGSRGGIRSSPV